MGSFAAFSRLMAFPDVSTVLDIGSGGGQHAKMMRAAGKKVTTISLIPPADFIGDYLDFPESGFDAVWASHVLEHQQNVGLFLRKCFADLRDDGVFAVTVPPLKHSVVGGHLNLFNAGTLVYNLVVAGFDCSKAAVGTYGYNISVIVRKKAANLPKLNFDSGDINKLAEFFPIPLGDGFDGQYFTANW
jgi:SAM-dependent methyltransferase